LNSDQNSQKLESGDYGKVEGGRVVYAVGWGMVCNRKPNGKTGHLGKLVRRGKRNR